MPNVETLNAGRWKPETGNRKLVTGNRKLKTEKLKIMTNPRSGSGFRAAARAGGRRGPSKSWGAPLYRFAAL
jgi:hypothetical protein